MCRDFRFSRRIGLGLVAGEVISAKNRACILGALTRTLMTSSRGIALALSCVSCKYGLLGGSSLNRSTVNSDRIGVSCKKALVSAVDPATPRMVADCRSSNRLHLRLIREVQKRCGMNKSMDSQRCHSSEIRWKRGNVCSPPVSDEARFGLVSSVDYR